MWIISKLFQWASVVVILGVGTTFSVDAQVSTLGDFFPAGVYSVPSEQVDAWRGITPLARAYASPDYWRELSPTGPAVDVQYRLAVSIDLPDEPGDFDALLVFGETDRPGLLFVTVAYRVRGWHCLDAFFIDRDEWELVTDAQILFP